MLMPNQLTAQIQSDDVAGIEHPEKKIYAVQFHPEVNLTTNGKAMFSNFLFNIAGCSGSYTMEDRETSCIREITELVGEKKVLVLVSGGVDSSVCAALLNKAIGPERVVALHINNGFMRQNESELVMGALQRLGLPLRMVDASESFYNASTTVKRVVDLATEPNPEMSAPLKTCVEPEQKRRIIGDTFMHVADDAIKDLNLKPEDVFLAQGTLRPDLIESASHLASSGGTADAIKTHHNDTQLVRALRAQGRVVEPLKDYHKDEVRQLGRSLGLPDDLVDRQPFPGPGLAIRVICTAKPFIGDGFEPTNNVLKYLTTKDASLLDAATAATVDAAVKSSGLGADGLLASYSCTLLPVRTVGVQGDGRTYSYVAALTKTGAVDNWKEVLDVAKLIPRVCHEVNRVVYVWGEPITGPITTITPTTLMPEVLEQLREADAIVNKELVANKLVTKVAQVPVVSVPVDPDFAGKGNSTRRSIAIRTFLTADFMTGVPVVRKCYPAGSCVDTREDPDGWCGIGWCGTARQWQSARVVSKQ